jgi:metallo-beta-lactamase class B
MRNHATALAIFSSLIGTSAFAQNAPETVDSHLIAARTAAAFDFTGTLARLCIAPVAVPGALRDLAPGPAPARDTWFIEPAKVFDNLYFVGSKIHSSWALTTSQGIILIDTLFTYNSEEEIVGGLKKLGLDPATVKYVIISHAHSDHVGGAKMMQDRFGSRLVMGAPDWDSIERSVNGYPQGKPRRDIVPTTARTTASRSTWRIRAARRSTSPARRRTSIPTSNPKPRWPRLQRNRTPPS